MVVNCGLSGNHDKTIGKQPVSILVMTLAYVVLAVASSFYSIICLKYLSQVKFKQNPALETNMGTH